LLPFRVITQTGAPIIAYLFFYNAPPTPEIYTLSLHDALPIFGLPATAIRIAPLRWIRRQIPTMLLISRPLSRPIASPLIPLLERSEEHTSELQSLAYLVCRLLLEKKNKQ